MENNRANMIHNISVTSFYLDDLRLFLDTHPDDAKALSMYDEYSMKRKDLVRKYVAAYGPLKFYDMNGADTWKWVEYPWPWEGEGVC